MDCLRFSNADKLCRRRQLLTDQLFELATRIEDDLTPGEVDDLAQRLTALSIRLRSRST